MGRISNARGKLYSGTPKEKRLWSQRLEAKPYANCRFWSFMSMAWWAGLRFDKTDGSRGKTAVQITETLRWASGVPQTYPDGRTRGTSPDDLDRGLAKVFPWMVVHHGWLPIDEVFQKVKDRRIIASVPVWLPDVPARIARFSGNGNIGHQVTFAAARKTGTRQFLYLDPLGVAPYAGDWVAISTIKEALYTYGEKMWVSYMEVLDHMQTTITPVRALPPGSKAAVTRKVIPAYKVKGGDFVRVKDREGPATFETPYVAEVLRDPNRGGPVGRYVFASDGPLAGLFVRRSDVELDVAETPDAAAEYARGVTDGTVAERAKYQPVEETLFARQEEE